MDGTCSTMHGQLSDIHLVKKTVFHGVSLLHELHDGGSCQSHVSPPPSHFVSPILLTGFPLNFLLDVYTQNCSSHLILVPLCPVYP
jgi:hypothetical protein